jgi:type I restriction enzyme S subunit
MVPDGWRRVALNQIISIKHGFAFQSEHFEKTGPCALLTPGNFNEAGGFRSLGPQQKYYDGPIQNNFVLKEGDLLIAMTEQAPGLLGAAVRIPGDKTYLHNQRLGLVDVLDTEAVSVGFVYHMFNSSDVRKEISTTASGTKVKHTSPAKVGAIQIILPRRSEQDEIAYLLDTWDTGTEKTEQLVAAKERHYTHELSRFISRVQHPQNHISVFAREVSERNCDRVCERVLSVTNDRGFVLPEHQFERRVASEDLSNYKIVRKGQYAYNPSRINVGSIARLDDYDIGVLSPMYSVFAIDETKVNTDFFKHWLDSHEARERIKRSAQGSVRETVSFTEFATIRFSLPLLEQQQKIANYLSTLREEIALLAAYAGKLKEQKRGLMQKLLTGQWRVKVSEEVNQ